MGEVATNLDTLQSKQYKRDETHLPVSCACRQLPSASSDCEIGRVLRFPERNVANPWLCRCSSVCHVLRVPDCDPCYITCYFNKKNAGYSNKNLKFANEGQVQTLNEMHC